MKQTIDVQEFIPPQKIGSEHDALNSKKFQSVEEAISGFDSIKFNLLDVNHWHVQMRGKSAQFYVTDEHGNKDEGLLKSKSLIRIDMPGPKNRIGKRWDWVQVNFCKSFNPQNMQVLVFQLSPCICPYNPNGGIAHFYEDSASNTFILIRLETIIQLSIHGRNERPNTKCKGLRNKFRNQFIANGGIFGGSKVQWKTLVEEILTSN